MSTANVAGAGGVRLQELIQVTNAPVSNANTPSNQRHPLALQTHRSKTLDLSEISVKDDKDNQAVVESPILTKEMKILATKEPTLTMIDTTVNAKQ